VARISPLGEEVQGQASGTSRPPASFVLSPLGVVLAVVIGLGAGVIAFGIGVLAFDAAARSIVSHALSRTEQLGLVGLSAVIGLGVAFHTGVWGIRQFGTRPDTGSSSLPSSGQVIVDFEAARQRRLRTQGSAQDARTTRSRTHQASPRGPSKATQESSLLDDFVVLEEEASIPGGAARPGSVVATSSFLMESPGASAPSQGRGGSRSGPTPAREQRTDGVESSASGGVRSKRAKTRRAKTKRQEQPQTRWDHIEMPDGTLVMGIVVNGQER